MGIEPTPSAWKAEVLPLNYTRITRTLTAGNPATSHTLATHDPPSYPPHCLVSSKSSLVARRWRGEDSNLRRLSRQIYSLIPLATREPLRDASRSFWGTGSRLSILRKNSGNQRDCRSRHEAGLTRFPATHASSARPGQPGRGAECPCFKCYFYYKQ